MKQFATAMLAALGMMLAALPAARADTTCPPSPPIGSTVNGNLVVPSGQICFLGGVTVIGNVQVQTNASIALGGVTVIGNVRVQTNASLANSIVLSTIDGNIETDQCNFVHLFQVTVGGNVDIENCRPGNSDIIGYIAGHGQIVQIDGNFTCNNNVALVCFAVNGQVQGNVQINNNRQAQVIGNTIGGNLQCQGNTGGATDNGQPNTVAGHKLGQCAGL
jgi:hypothetical protein